MRIDELKRIAKENDYEYEYDKSCFRIRFKREVAGYTNKISINVLVENRIWIYNDNFCDEKDFNMIKAAMKCAETPLEDREEEKRFHLKHRWMTGIDGDYLSLDLEQGGYYLDDKYENYWQKTQFTKKEIEEIKEKFNTDLADFKKVEV